MPAQRLAIVVTYFGPTPFWFPAFLHSCRGNPDVRWLLYSDMPVTHVPQNVTHTPTQLADLNALCSKLLGVPVQIAGRKINDFKPFYGALFERALHEFEFWAYSDLDIVWGHVGTFLSDAVLSDVDVLSSRRDKLSGHFTLFRNTSTMNCLFESIPDVREAMAQRAYAHLDERQLTDALKRRLREAGRPRVSWQRELTTNAEYQRSMGDGPADYLTWRQGHMFGVHGEELMYLHFHKLKRHMRTINFSAADQPTSFRISRAGIVA